MKVMVYKVTWVEVINVTNTIYNTCYHSTSTTVLSFIAGIVISKLNANHNFFVCVLRGNQGNAPFKLFKFKNYFYTNHISVIIISCSFKQIKKSKPSDVYFESKVFNLGIFLNFIAC